jgi:hypothetical protein
MWIPPVSELDETGITGRFARAGFPGATAQMADST